MLKLLLNCLPLTVILACAEDPQPPAETVAPAAAGNAAVIRNAVAESAPDSSTAATMDFAETEYVFGEVKEGTIVRHTFAFTNTGKLPLLITDARSTCGCTVPSYPKEPVAPGATGTVEVVFNTTHKYGRQRKPVTLTANTNPSITTIYVDGTVINE
ncbi:uncharacterized protein DUF1573 [Neolewinella xylanilytica]|uniref:Uncharacterized protein DUF1573 n=1 Tax=Neolewinella xylanilytica TaxID=1514080 RepID=A0A2S6I632_9BACT|nr:DUF1573 domain-containing protein [Neolewinella xylanilytica]PPK86632.1 uncharacterized protein DUF1573 [Neolewinella xylanilytica]